MAKQTPAPNTKAKSKEASKSLFGLSVQNAAALVVFLFSFAIYTNSIFNDYNMDDELVTRNHRLTSKGISAIPEILTSPYYQDKAGYEYEYRPMVLISFAIEKSFIGEGPGRSHFINVLLYSFMCSFLFLLLRKLFSSYNIIFPLLVTLIFAAHPIHTEVVASIKNRDEIMALFFGLGALWFALKYTQQKAMWQLALVPAMMLLAMLSKSTAITFAVLVPLALVLLTQARLGSILLVTTLLLPPSLAYARLYAILQVVGLAAAVYAVVLVLYAIKNMGFVQQSIAGMLSSFKSKEEEKGLVSDGSEKADFTFLKRPLIMLPLTLACLAGIALSAWGAYLADAWLAGLPLLALAVVYVLGGRGMQLLLSMPIALLGIYMVVRVGGGIYPVYEGLLIGFLATLVLDKDKRFNAIGWVAYVAYAALSVLVLQHSIFIGLLFFIGLFSRRLLVVSIVFMAVSAAWFAYKSVTLGQINIKYISFPVLYGVFALLYYNRSKYLQQALVLLLPIGAIAYFSLYSVNNYRPASSAINYAYTSLKVATAPDITPVKANRALIYHEWPFDGTESVSTKLGTALMVLGRYLRMTFVPYPMSFYYGYPYLDKVGMSNVSAIISLLLHLLLLGAALFYIRNKPIVAFGILFYLVAISPYSGLLVPVPGIMADRFLLVPTLGFALLLVYVLSVIFKNVLTQEALSLQNVPSALKGTLVVILLAYAGLTIARNQDWENHVQLFTKDIKVVPNSAQGQYLLGVHLFKAAAAQNDMQQRIALSEQAIERYKLTTQLYAPFMNPWFDIGNTYTLIGEQYNTQGNKQKAAQCFDSALVYYEGTVRIKPDFTKPYFTMGRLEQAKGNYNKAIAYYEEYLKTFPDQMDAATNLSLCYFMLKDYDKAVLASQNYLTRNPNTYQPLINIGKIYLEQGRGDSSILYYEKAYALQQTDIKLAQFIYQLSVRFGDTKRIEEYGLMLDRRGIRR